MGKGRCGGDCPIWEFRLELLLGWHVGLNELGIIVEPSAYMFSDNSNASDGRG